MLSVRLASRNANRSACALLGRVTAQSAPQCLLVVSDTVCGSTSLVMQEWPRVAAVSCRGCSRAARGCRAVASACSCGGPPWPPLRMTPRRTLVSSSKPAEIQSV